MTTNIEHKRNLARASMRVIRTQIGYDRLLFTLLPLATNKQISVYVEDTPESRKCKAGSLVWTNFQGSIYAPKDSDGSEPDNDKRIAVLSPKTVFDEVGKALVDSMAVPA